MRKISILFLGALLLGLPLASALNPQLFTTKTRYAVLKAEVSPQPVRPGGDLLLKVNFIGIDVSDFAEATLRLDAKGPFSFKFPDEKRVRITDLPTLRAYEQDYHLTVAPDARTGIYDVDLYVEVGDGEIELKQGMRIKVEGRPELIILDPTLSKEKIVPGDEVAVAFTIQNSGTGEAKDVRVLLDIGGLPFIPLEDNSVFIEKLPVGQKKDIAFRLKASQDAPIGSYQVPIRINGFDETGTMPLNATELIGAEVLGEAVIDLAGVNTDPMVVRSGDDFALMMTLENSGTGDASAVSAAIDLPLAGTKQAFLNELEPDEDASAVFSLEGSPPGRHDYTLSVAYTDDTGQKTKAYPLQIYVAQESPIAFWLVPVIVLASAVVGSLTYQRFRKRKHEAKAPETPASGPSREKTA